MLLDDLSAAAGVEFDKNLSYYARTLTSYEASARHPGPELTPITHVDINPESQQ